MIYSLCFGYSKNTEPDIIYKKKKRKICVYRKKAVPLCANLDNYAFEYTKIEDSPGAGDGGGP